MRVSFALLLCLAAATGWAQGSELFPRPAAIEPAVRFWTRVYTEIGTSQGFVHDTEHLDVVYETIDVPEGMSPRARRQRIESTQERYRTILTKLGNGRRENLSAEERRVLALWPDDVSNAQLRRAADNLRFQLGQANRFRAGLARSGAWKPYILDTLRERGLPLELAALPHVESSFDPTAYSKVGAAGMWQFTRGTGVRYMRIDHIVDERRDPFISTRAAARLLEDNYAVIDSWPLALTAYNHGLAGMRRAVEQVGTKDIDQIIARYKSRSFGFASRNFYAAFLAALDVDRRPEAYFGQVAIDPPANSQIVVMPDYMTAADLAAGLGLPLGTLAALNPALMAPVWSGDKFVPRGFELRLPGSIDAATRLAAIPATQRYAAQQPDLYHVVRRGDTLSGIAQQYRVSLTALRDLNGGRDMIRVGQRVTLPTSAQASAAVRVAAAAAPAPRASAPAPVAESGTYVVRRGDSIEAIARRLGVDAAQLLALNGITNPDRIYVGQRLAVTPAGTDDGPQPVLVAAAMPVAAAADASGGVETAAVTEAVHVVEVADDPVEETPVALEAVADATAEDLDLTQENALETAQAALAADPSDYSVDPDTGTIEVQALETLGHYADWLGIRTQRLRDLNRLPFGQAVVMGTRLKLDFSRVDAATFEQRRSGYHQGLQETFFAAHRITDTVLHTVRPGESLWVLAFRRYEVPVWLLRQYNPDLDLNQVRPGTVVKFPKLIPLAAEANEPELTAQADEAA